MWCCHLMWLTTSMLCVSSWVTGWVAYFAFPVWLGDWSGVPFTQSMYWLSYNFIIIFSDECMVSFLISVLANEDLLKSVLECSDLVVSSWKRDHPSDTEDDALVGLSSKDEVEGLAIQPGVARKGARVPAAVLAEVSAAVLAVPQPSADEVLVKRSLKQVKQQVSALLCGKTFLRMLRPGRLLKSATSCWLFLGRPRTVQCASSPLKPTTG